MNFLVASCNLDSLPFEFFGSVNQKNNTHNSLIRKLYKNNNGATLFDNGEKSSKIFLTRIELYIVLFQFLHWNCPPI